MVNQANIYRAENGYIILVTGEGLPRHYIETSLEEALERAARHLESNDSLTVALGFPA